MTTRLEATQLEERVNVVADDGVGDTVLETVARSYAQENRLLTWTSQVVVLNSERYVLVTLRSKKCKKYPSYWEIGITETVRSGERKREAARWGIEEELKIPINKQGPLIPCFKNFFRDMNDAKNRKNAMVFIYFSEDGIDYDLNEISEGKLLTPDEIDWEISEGKIPYTPMNIRTWELLKGYVKRESGLYVRQ